MGLRDNVEGQCNDLADKALQLQRLMAHYSSSNKAVQALAGSKAGARAGGAARGRQHARTLATACAACPVGSAACEHPRSRWRPCTPPHRQPPPCRPSPVGVRTLAHPRPQALPRPTPGHVSPPPDLEP